MSDDNKADQSDTSSERISLTRRKLGYVAPVLVSRAMMYGAAGCGKADPRTISCQVVRRGGS
jgi:hypothetical protein